MSESASRNELVRGLTLAGAISINVANMIGTGVFLKARVMTCNVETPGMVLAAWLLAGMLVLAGALTFAELASRMPSAGGEYVFIREAYGRRWAFLQGWTLVFISRTASHAAQAVGAAIFFNMVTGGILDGPAVLGLSRLQVASLASIALVLSVNAAAVSVTGRVALALTIIKVAVAGGVGVIAFLFAGGDWGHFLQSGSAGSCEAVDAGARDGLAGFGAAMLGALWGFQGWANLTPLVGEVRDPARNIPRAFLLATLIVGLIYLFANASYFYALTPVEVASVPLSSSVATEVIRRLFGPVTAGLLTAAMLISSLGALQSGFAGTMRIPFAMARDGVFFPVFGQVSPKSRVPLRAALLVAGWTGLLSLSGSYDRLTDYAIFALWLFYGFTASTLFVFRRRTTREQLTYRAWGYPVVPALFLLATACLLVNTLWTAPIQSMIGLALMVGGMPFYEGWARRPRSAALGAGL
jgi:APA family basic amino acid/polyamine antiporter